MNWTSLEPFCSGSIILRIMPSPCFPLLITNCTTPVVPRHIIMQMVTRNSICFAPGAQESVSRPRRISLSLARSPLDAAGSSKHRGFPSAHTGSLPHLPLPLHTYGFPSAHTGSPPHKPPPLVDTEGVPSALTGCPGHWSHVCRYN